MQLLPSIEVHIQPESDCFSDGLHEVPQPVMGWQIYITAEG